MLGKYLTAEGTATQSIFQAQKEEGGQPAGEGGEAAAATQETQAKKEIEVLDGMACLFISDVSREPKMKYFRVPKLGSYFAISLKYLSCLYEDCLENAVKNYYTTMEQRAKQEKDLQEEKEKEKDKDASVEDSKKVIVEPVKIEEPPYDTHERLFVLCMDTMGQDRVFSEHERKFAIEIAKLVVNCWQESEKQALTLDKNLRVSIKNKDEETKKDIETVNEEIEKAGTDALSEESRSDLKEGEADAISGAAKIRCMAKHLTAGKYNSELAELKSFTILLFPRIFQYALYLLGYERKDICEPETNKLWWVQRKQLIDEKFFNLLADYTPVGPKAGVYPKYRTINAIEKNISEVVEEKVVEYSTAYYMLLKWIKECVKVRKLDISVRKAKRQAAAQEREAKMNEKTAWETKRAEELKAAIEEAKNKFIEEKKKKEEEEKPEEDEFENLEGHTEKKETEEFTYDEATLMAEWDEKNPPPEIPPVMPDEKDNDYEQQA